MPTSEFEVTVLRIAEDTDAAVGGYPGTQWLFHFSRALIAETKLHLIAEIKKPQPTIKPQPEVDDGRCHSNCDGDCTWKFCPQIRDDEPTKSGRHCPNDKRHELDY
jgi:hypothetical protein